MAFLDDLGAKLTQTGQKTKKMANDLMEVTRLNAKAGELTKELETSYGSIGESYFKLHGTAPEEELAALCAQVRAKQEELTILRADIQRLKNIRVCPACSNENPPDAAFCGQCSAPLPELPQRPDSQPSFCPSCGVQLPPGAHFCTKCGTKI